MRKPPGRIFISYRRDDMVGVAGRLSDALNRYFGPGRVFRDVDGIEAGANFEQVLNQTTQNADAMLVLIGRDWATISDAQGRRRLHDPQDWVAREIGAALEKKIPVFPVLVENAAMPRAEDLPAALQPLLRHNAISISDQRWVSDVMRLAKVVAIDIPGSAAERTLQRVRLAISMALVAAIAMTTSIVVLNVDQGVKPPLALWQSGVTYVVVVGCSTLLLAFARLIDPPVRRWAHAAAVLGLLGTLVSFVLLAFIGDDSEAIISFLGSTITATSMLALMNLSGFKAR